jgi:hypothetical protein
VKNRSGDLLAYTSGYELLVVCLANNLVFARAHIEQWVEQARIQQRIDSLQKDMDREDYKALLTLYSETLDNLKYRLDIERQYAFEITYNASIREQYEQIRHSLPPSRRGCPYRRRHAG